MNIAQKLMDHRFAGLCPDAVDGWDRRDPDCPACRALDDLAEQGTEEWEYSIAYPRGDEWDPDGVEPFDSEQDAWDDLAKGDYLSSDRVVHRRKAGPWVPVDQPASTPGVDTRTPSGPKTAEVHPDSYPDYATDRPIRHEDWCHAVTGCSEAGHCTCDGTDRPDGSTDA